MNTKIRFEHSPDRYQGLPAWIEPCIDLALAIALMVTGVLIVG